MIRNYLTVAEFKSYLMLHLKHDLEVQRAQALALRLSIASILSEEAGNAAKELSDSINNQIEDLDQSARAAMGAGDVRDIEYREVTRGSQRISYTAEPSGPSGEVAALMKRFDLSENDAKAWRKTYYGIRAMSKLDIGFSKLTGKITGNPISVVNAGNAHESTQDLMRRADAKSMSLMKFVEMYHAAHLKQGGQAG